MNTVFENIETIVDTPSLMSNYYKELIQPLAEPGNDIVTLRLDDGEVIYFDVRDEKVSDKKDGIYVIILANVALKIIKKFDPDHQKLLTHIKNIVVGEDLEIPPDMIMFNYIKHLVTVLSITKYFVPSDTEILYVPAFDTISENPQRIVRSIYDSIGYSRVDKLELTTYKDKAKASITSDKYGLVLGYQVNRGHHLFVKPRDIFNRYVLASDIINFLTLVAKVRLVGDKPEPVVDNSEVDRYDCANLGTKIAKLKHKLMTKVESLSNLPGESFEEITIESGNTYTALYLTGERLTVAVYINSDSPTGNAFIYTVDKVKPMYVMIETDELTDLISELSKVTDEYHIANQMWRLKVALVD